MVRTRNNSDRGGSADEDVQIRSKLPEAVGLAPDNSHAMRLVNHILQPESADAAAHALFDLLHQVGWNDEAADRHMVALCASIQTALYFDGWEKGMRQLIAAIHQDDRRRGAEQGREGHAEET